MTLLLVEDELSLANSLRDFLEAEGGYAVHVARSAEEARQACLPGVSLVLLDWGLPDGSGLSLLREWRAAGRQMPVLFLTARADLVDKVLGLEEGANDYITKPFDTRELLARVRAQLRGMGTPPTTLSYAGIRLDLATREVSYRNEAVSLVHLEFELLKYLMQYAERVFTRAELLDQVWGYENYPTTRTVDFHISQLRQKIEAGLFETVRGVGYRLTTPVEVPA